MRMFFLIMLILITLSCTKEDNDNITISNVTSFISAVDLSSLPKIEAANAVFYNLNNQEEDVLSTLKRNGVNTIRLKLWHNPINNSSSFTEVKAFAERIKSKGLKLWITVHYSDTWADPANQSLPLAWQGKTFSIIKEQMYLYTKKIVLETLPDFIQIGNEINSGLLFPYGKINQNEAQFLELLSTGSRAVRENSNETKIIIHYAGITGSDWFFNKIKSIDYDIIGISYYPIWHGKDLNLLESTLSNLEIKYSKEFLIAETAYPFTLQWNDWTHNIVGLEEQLILPEYPATPQGQKKFLVKLKDILKSTNKGIGFCYWEGGLIAFDGQNSTNGSPWENQALYDFNNKGLPILNEFQITN